jgi:hypothetical protein
MVKCMQTGQASRLSPGNNTCQELPDVDGFVTPADADVRDWPTL